MFDWLRSRRRRGQAPEHRSNGAWLDAMRARDAAALEDLRAVLVRGLRAALRRRTPRQADALAEDFAQEALLQILDRLDTFRGEARFTTWAHKVAVHLALSELRRKRWKDVALQDVLPPGGIGRLELAGEGASPEEEARRRRQIELIRQVMEEDLTERQRTALAAVMLGGMPGSEVARRMGTNRNALYKLLYDARRNMKRGFEARGITLDDLLDE